MTEQYLWKDRYLMAAVEVDHNGKHRQIHLWPGPAGGSLCNRYGWKNQTVDKTVATGWPDCDECKDEAFRRMLT